MSASGDASIAAAAIDASTEFNPDAMIATLRAAGADRFDPVQFRYVEALAERASSHRGSARRLLDARLAQALATFKERFAAAQSDAREVLERGAQRDPQAAKELQRLHGAGDFRAMRRLALGPKPPRQSENLSLGALVKDLEHRKRHAADDAEARWKGHAGLRPELRTIRSFKNTLSKLNVHRQVAQALEQAPKNAGPINSHMLLLRSLALMRDISPDYLNRFLSYADALLCLDQCEKEKPAASKKPQAAKAAKK